MPKITLLNVKYQHLQNYIITAATCWATSHLNTGAVAVNFVFSFGPKLIDLSAIDGSSFFFYSYRLYSVPALKIQCYGLKSWVSFTVCQKTRVKPSSHKSIRSSKVNTFTASIVHHFGLKKTGLHPDTK